MSTDRHGTEALLPDEARLLRDLLADTDAMRAAAAAGARAACGEIGHAGVGFVRAAIEAAFIARRERLNAEAQESQRMLSERFPGAGAIATGYWECPDSPVGVCVYDDDADPDHDWCLVCENPHERK